MKKSMAFSVLILSATMIFSACSNYSSYGNDTTGMDTPPLVENQESDTNSEITEGHNNDASVRNDSEANDSLVSGGIQLAGSHITVAQLEGGLNIGATQEEVSILFDSHPYHEVTALIDSEDAWRYDIGAEADYSYENRTDQHDHEGILNGKVQLQIFIYFDEGGQVSAYTAYQAAADGEINVYQTLNNGTRKVEIIS